VPEREPDGEGQPPRRAADEFAPGGSARPAEPTIPPPTQPEATGAEPPEPEATGAEPPEPEPHLQPSGRFGQPGPPLRRNPFLVGFAGGLGVLLAYAVFLGVRNAASILVLVFIALFLAIGLNPVVERLRSWGLLIALGVLLLLCGGLTALVPPLVAQIGQLIDQLPTYLENLQRSRTINELVQRYGLADRLQSVANPQNAMRALGGVFGGARLLFGTVFNVLTVLVLTIYFMAAFDRIRAGAYALAPASRRKRVQLIGDEILTKVGAYMVGALAIAVLAGLSTFIFAVVAGLAYPFALAVVVAIFDLIPQIGATLGAIVITVVGFATSVPVGIAAIVFFLVYQQIENYLIYPKVMRRSVQVSDVAAIVAALLGVALLGVVGALIAIPAVAAIQLIMREIVLPRQQQR
jgi:predicted PurR-regulated permease PerM